MWSKKVEVQTPLGPVKGTKIETSQGFPIYTFQGIPYAKPPVGALRFKSPVPVEPWVKVLDATRPSRPAPCLNLEDRKLEVKPGSSEDCLYLNVYAPKVPNSKLELPVMVWIHGGGFAIGCANRDDYGPDYLVPRDVILVTVNYRLGVFGFLSFKNAECPGNFGLKDQALALRWVRDNISAFGGNPNNVTLFGSNSGAACVQYHMLSPMSKGLFHKAISQSGSILCRMSYARQPIESGLLLAKKLGCDTKDPTEAFNTIRQSSMSNIAYISDGIGGEISGNWCGENIFNVTFAPTSEPEGVADAFMTKTPEQALADGDCMDIPHIQGICSCEMNFSLLSDNYVPWYTKDEHYQYLLPKELGVPLNSKLSIAAAAKLRKFYFSDGNTQEGFLKAQNAVWTTYPMYRYTRSILKDKSHKSPSYLYISDVTRYPSAFRSVLLIGLDVPGASHNDDVEFLFYPSMGKWGKKAVDPDSKEGKIQALLTKLWTNFAKTGVPSPDWPAVDDKSWQHVLIRDTLQIKTHLFKDEVQFWDDLYSFMKS